MHVLDIIVTSTAYSSEGRNVIGTVKFLLEDEDTGLRPLIVDCEAPVSARIRPDAVLIGDAIRQLRRMPEIRNGTARLSFAKGLKPLQARNAA